MSDDSLLDALDHLARAGVSVTTRALAETGSTAELTLQQWRALVVIAEAGIAGIRVGDLGRGLRVAAPGASRLVRRLETRGLAVVTRDGPDRRAAVVRATDTGRALWTAVILRRRALIAQALDGTTEATTNVGAYLEEIARALVRNA